MTLVEWPSQMLVPQLRRLQHAANMLNLREFCQAIGCPVDDYSKAKFREFQALGRLHVFDDHVLQAAVAYYEQQEEGRIRAAAAAVYEANHPEVQA